MTDCTDSKPICRYTECRELEMLLRNNNCKFNFKKESGVNLLYVALPDNKDSTIGQITHKIVTYYPVAKLKSYNERSWTACYVLN